MPTIPGTSRTAENAHRPRRRRRALAALACGLLTAGLIAGCSSSGTSASPASPASPSAAGPAGPAASGSGTPATGTAVKLAVLLDGGSGSPDDPEHVLQAWAKWVNANGGVAGHPVDFEILVTNADASTAKSEIAPVLRDKSVVGIVMMAPVTEAVVAASITAAGIPVIGGAGYAPTAWGTMPNWISLFTSFPAVAAGDISMAKADGATKPAVVVCSEIPNCAEVGQLTAVAAKSLGMQYGGTLTASSSASDYTAQCLKLISDHVDYVIPSLSSVAADMNLISSCQTQGYTGQWGLFDGSVQPSQIEAASPQVTINLGLTNPPWFAADAPIKQFQQVVGQEGVAEPDWAFPEATAAWTTMTLFKKVLDGNASSLSPTVTRAEIISAYGTVRNERLGGLLAQPLSFTADKPAAPVDCFWTAKYENGEFTGGALDKTACYTAAS
jgi:branched-chain amino acid transport system substrate-binding protein